jgi:hypothetical protein
VNLIEFTYLKVVLEHASNHTRDSFGYEHNLEGPDGSVRILGGLQHRGSDLKVSAYPDRVPSVRLSLMYFGVIP